MSTADVITCPYCHEVQDNDNVLAYQCKHCQKFAPYTTSLVGEPTGGEGKGLQGRQYTPEELRRLIVSGINDALDRPILARFLGVETKRMMRAQARYWQEADAAAVQKLIDLLNQEP